MRVGLLGAVVFVAVSGCGQAAETVAPGPDPSLPATTAAAAATESQSPRPASSMPTASPPCDPGGGFPRDKSGCPDPDPETGWLSREQGEPLQLAPFRTYTVDAEGKAYAKEHGLGFPFLDDYYDAAEGPARRLDLGHDTVCTGIILVGHHDPLEDHRVECAAMVRAAASQLVPVAVWRDGDRVVQVSELYRP